MGKIQINNNYRAVIEGLEPYDFYAVSDAQAWHFAMEWSEGELLDYLYEISELGVVIRRILESYD